MDNYVEEVEMRKCAYEGCQCLVADSQDYCSAICSAADDVGETELECDCGHDPCALA